MKLTIHINELAGADARQAHYLAALSTYRLAAREFAGAIEATGHADQTPVDLAAAALEALERPPELIQDLMRPVREVAAATGLSISQTRNLANGAHSLADQVRSEQRFGKLWYLYPPHVHRLIAAGEIKPRGQKLVL